MSPEPNLKGCRVLVVEDEFLIAYYLKRELGQLGANVIGPVARIPEALAAIADCDPEAAVVDVNLAGEMAYPVADALLARGVPMVFATGYDRDAIPERYADVPRRLKPVVAAELVRALFP